MSKNLYLFDVDGTLAESGKKVSLETAKLLNKLKEDNEIGIVGGGKYSKILEQFTDKETNETLVNFNYYFSECGCVLHINNELIYEKSIREHKLYSEINILIKLALKYLSEVDYELSGHFIDLRTGIIYISLIGLNANDKEREIFMKLDKKFEYRKKLLDMLEYKALELDIYNKLYIVYGGSVGIAIYPNECDKKQVMNFINCKNYKEIHYFGDKYEKNGNDYGLLNHEYIVGHNIECINNTNLILKSIIK